MTLLKIKNRDIFVPGLFKEFINEESGFVFVDLNDTSSFNRIIKYLRSKKHIIIQNSDEKRTADLYEYICKRTDDIVLHRDRLKVMNKKFSGNRKREYERSRSEILNRILITAKNNSITSFTVKSNFPYLVSFCGENISSYISDTEFLLPFKFFSALKNCLKEGISLSTPKTKIFSGPNVLMPRSQETIELFRQAISDINLRSGLKILDMGCGSGVLTILAGSLFERSELHFSDILPESIASTLYNIHNLGEDFLEKNKYIYRESADLFEHIDEKFDLIMFNPPWVNAPARNRSELALNDKDMKTLERFLMQARHHISPDGKIILAFSDNSGDKAVEKFISLLAKYGFTSISEYIAKVQSHQSGRKWMKIFVRTLKTATPH